MRFFTLSSFLSREREWFHFSEVFFILFKKKQKQKSEWVCCCSETFVQTFDIPLLRSYTR